MPNPYFQFKKFTVWQETVGMKVTTDACLFGALITPGNAKSALDIGTGTGLLALMLAQKTDIPITAIELNASAYQQAEMNFARSPWAKRLKVVQGDVLEFRPEKGLDLIICNPPFFQHKMKGSSSSKNQAMFQESLSLEHLAEKIDVLLNENGTFWVMLPPHEMESFSDLPEIKELHLSHQIAIHNQATNPLFRVIKAFKRKATNVQHQVLNIRDGVEYTTDFKDLLNPYYLHL